jgi:hypothetical protein
MALILGQVGARLETIDVACSRCDRRGKLNTARLVAAHGAASRSRRSAGGDRLAHIPQPPIP